MYRLVSEIAQYVNKIRVSGSKENVSDDILPLWKCAKVILTVEATALFWSTLLNLLVCLMNAQFSGVMKGLILPECPVKG